MTMKGWILYRDKLSDLEQIPYEIQKLIDTAKANDIDLKVFQPEEFDLMVTRKNHKSILHKGNEIDLPDFVLTRLGAGITYFGQAVVRQLEREGVRVINTSSGIDMSKDKLYSQQILAASGLPVPRTVLLKQPVNVALIEDKLRFPVVMKTLSGSKGSGVFLANNKDEFVDLIDFLASNKGSANLIIQEFLKESKGRDLRVFVLGGRVLACMQRSSKAGFKANVSRGGSAQAYEVTPEIEWIALEAARILELDIAGIDLLFDGNTFSVCEANASPGFMGIESCFPDLNVAAEIFRYVRLRVGFRKKNAAPQELTPIPTPETQEETPS